MTSSEEDLIDKSRQANYHVIQLSLSFLGNDMQGDEQTFFNKGLKCSKKFEPRKREIANWAKKFQKISKRKEKN